MKAKLKLDDIKIESFVTSLDEKTQLGLMGATNEDEGCAPTGAPTCFSCASDCVSGACGTCALTGPQCAYC